MARCHKGQERSSESKYRGLISPDLPQIGARADSSEFLEKFPPSFQQAAYNPSANVVLDDKPSSTLPDAGPGRAPPEETQVPLALNEVHHPGYAVGTPE